MFFPVAEIRDWISQAPARFEKTFREEGADGVRELMFSLRGYVADIDEVGDLSDNEERSALLEYNRLLEEWAVANDVVSIRETAAGGYAAFDDDCDCCDDYVPENPAEWLAAI